MQCEVIWRSDDGIGVEMDSAWRIRQIDVAISNAGAPDRSLRLASDGEGHWQDAEGAALPQFDGCLDIDISATPFTKTLPIRRLRMQPGQVEPIAVLFIHVPTLKTEPWAQRYTGLEPGLVRYESIGSDFRRELSVDADGLAIEYPGLFSCVYAR